MLRRPPNPRAIGGILVAVVLLGDPSATAAQQPTLRPGQSPGPRFIMPTLKSDGSRLGFQVANAVRERIASDFDMRTLWVVPESTITKYLADAGYPADQPLSTAETRQLASSFRADELLNGVVSKTPSGGYRVQAAWSLAPREDMVQPLPAVEAAKISDVAKLVAREFQAARRQVEFVQRCINLARARNYAGALSEARKAIDAYPKSVLGRVCIANIYDQQKLGPESMIQIAEEILAIHPENGRALAFAADAYQTKGLLDDQIRILKRLTAVDSTNRRARVALAIAFAGSGKPDSAQPIIDSVVAQDPENVEAVSTQWRVHLATKDWVRAIEIGERTVQLDSSLATRDFFIRMIAAASAAGQSQKALQLATRGLARFPTDDEIAVLRVEYLRRTGQARQALDAVNAVVARNPRAPNALLLKARLESELGVGADTVVATLTRAIENGGNRASVAVYARTFGSAAERDSTAPNKLEPLRAAIRYFKFSESVQAGDTTSFRLGRTSVVLATQLANEPAAAKTCELAKELQAAVVEAQISLPKSGRSFPEEVPALMKIVSQLAPYGDQLAKAVCRKDEDQRTLSGR